MVSETAHPPANNASAETETVAKLYQDHASY